MLVYVCVCVCVHVCACVCLRIGEIKSKERFVVVQLLSHVQLWPHGLQHARLLCLSLSPNSHRETVMVNLYTYKYKNGVHILFLTDVLKENKHVSVCSSSVLMCFYLTQSMEEVKEKFLICSRTTKNKRKSGIKTRFLQNKIIFKVFLETSKVF